MIQKRVLSGVGPAARMEFDFGSGACWDWQPASKDSQMSQRLARAVRP